MFRLFKQKKKHKKIKPTIPTTIAEVIEKDAKRLRVRGSCIIG